MCELYLSSSSDLHFPDGDLRQLQRHGGPPWTNLHGWGLASRREDGGFALEKDAQPARGAPGYREWLDRAQPSRLHLLHLRAASSGGVSRANTQPYRFETWAAGLAGLYMHNGQLDGMAARLTDRFGGDPRESTADSEGGMILLREALRALETFDDSDIRHAAWRVFRHWAQEMKTMGIANFIVALGKDVFVHVHRRVELGGDAMDDTGLYMSQTPDMSQTRDRLRLSSEPMGEDDTPLPAGTLLWICGSDILERGLTI